MNYLHEIESGQAQNPLGSLPLDLQTKSPSVPAEKEMRIAIILGTRPEIVKMSPIIRECEKRRLDFFILHTGQHYSYLMDKLFFEQLDLGAPDHNLDAGSGTHAEQTGKILLGVERILTQERPSIVLVQGDTNTVLAGALAASKLHIKTGHVESGLRSYDRSMPEEINRIIADHISDYLFAPTETAKSNLLNEGIPLGKIFLTGNTIVDSVKQNLEISTRKVDALGDLGLKPERYVLVTAHREENVDSKSRLSNIIEGLRQICDEQSIPLVFPAHPRTLKRIKEFGLDLGEIRIIDPLGFLEFLQLESNAKLIITDSGGVQEEACILGVPCVTLRDNTERPETLTIGANALAGVLPDRIVEETNKMMAREANWDNPFGNGDAGKRIVEILCKEFGVIRHF